MTQAIIYCRFSPCPDAEECNSNARQEERCRVFCTRKNYNVVSVFSDEAISGQELTRPGLSSAMDVLKPGMIFIVDRNDRLARDLLVALTIRHEIEKLGCHIECADGTPPCNTPEGELFANILSAFAQFERKKIGQRTKAGLARKRDKGMYLGKCPIGYCRDEQGKLVKDADEQEKIYAILHWHKNEWAIPYIVDKAQFQFGDIRGKPWQERTVRRIIQREKNKEIT